MPYVFGVDGGGTRSRAILMTDRGRVVYHGKGPGLNYHDAGAGPVTATVKDQSAPEVPRGLSTQVADVSGAKRIVLTWDRNTDDAAGYRVYRFREWDHVGKKGPFPPVNGVAEGYITDVPQPASDKPFFLDTTINITQNENEAYWYCVSAFDADGARASAFNLTGPGGAVVPDVEVWEITATLGYSPVKDLMTRLEFRHDDADQDVFLDGSGLSDTQNTIAAEVIYSF